jgi:hypothetical protein
MLTAKRFRSNLFIAVTMSCIFAGCRTTLRNNSPEAKERMEQAYAKVELDNGINKGDASALADVYFHAYISGCGAIGETIDSGDTWEVKTVFGYAATPFAPIFVEKKTGKITCAKGPTIKPPEN